eukprot:gene3103-8199_t
MLELLISIVDDDDNDGDTAMNNFAQCRLCRMPFRVNYHDHEESQKHISRNVTSIPLLGCNHPTLHAQGVILLADTVQPQSHPCEHVAILGCPPNLDRMAYLSFLDAVVCKLKSVSVLNFTHQPSHFTESILILTLEPPFSSLDVAEMYTGQCFPCSPGRACLCLSLSNVTVVSRSMENQIASMNLDNSSPGVKDKVVLLPACLPCLLLLDEPVSHVIPRAYREWHDNIRESSTDIISQHCDDMTKSKPSCTKCNTFECVCMCLLCGEYFCGRPQRAHTVAHYHEMGNTHSFALELETGRIWDFDGDRYVHYLPSGHVSGKEREAAQDKQKQEEMQESSVSLLSVQLGTQREYFLDLIAQVERQHEISMQEMQRKISDLLSLTTATSQQLQEVQEEEVTVAAELDEATTTFKKEMDALRKLKQEVKSLQAQRQEQEASVVHERTEIQTAITLLQREISLRKKEIIDLQTHLSQAGRVAALGEDIQASHIVLTPKHRRRRRRR